MDLKDFSLDGKGDSSSHSAERTTELKNGSIRVYSLSSNKQIIVPETRNEPSLDAPRPRTAFAAPLRKCGVSRPITATSGISFLSESSMASTQASSMNLGAAIHPGNFSRGGSSWFSVTSRGPERLISTSSMTLNRVKYQEATDQNDKLRKKFQLPSIKEMSYNQWSVGMEDPTEESRNLHELSRMFYTLEQEPPADPQQPESEDMYKCNLLFGRITEFSSTFVRMPVPPGFFINCRITRSRKGINGKIYPTYYMHLERNGNPELLLLTANRSSIVKTDYVISTNPAEMSTKSDFCAGVLQTNIKGSEFSLTIPVKPDQSGESGDDPQKEWEKFLVLKFESNPLGIKGPRRLSVGIPKLKSDWEQCHPGPFMFPLNDEDPEHLSIVKNRVPRWSEETSTYVLNFSTRVQRSSVKNFQLAYHQDPQYNFTLLQFGRSYKNDVFILDYSYPFCPLQAFAIALSSFDARWGTD